ncbi:MAG: Heavy metal transport/detoxification protein, partial [uncultured bacterium]
SANALFGAAIMAAFVIGTVPLFFGVGWLTSILGDNFRAKFLKIAAVAVIYLGITSMNGALVAWGSPFSLPSIQIDLSGNSTYQAQIIQNPTIDILSTGYYPNYIKVKKGKTVNLTLKSTNAFSCASAFRIPSLKISKNLQPNDTQLISFVPTQVGKIQFSCSMGMYRGIIEVI